MADLEDALPLPYPYQISDFTAAIPNVLSDADSRTTAQLPGFVQRAILQRYSQDAPLEVVSDVQGNGTHNLPLPVAPTGFIPGSQELPVFEPNFSVVRRIEYPIGQQPPQLVLDSDLRVYRAPTGYTLLLDFDTPGEDESIRVTWTARHLIDGSTVPDKDFFAVVDYAASLAADWLSSFYVGTGDPTMSVDVVNYRSKSQEMASVAKALRKRYFNHMGVEEGTTGEAEVAPAFALGNQFLEQNSGVDRLVHDKYSR